MASDRDGWSEMGRALRGLATSLGELVMAVFGLLLTIVGGVVLIGWLW